MLTHEAVIRFLRSKPALSASAIEKEAGLPVSTLTKALADQRKLNQKHILQLLPVLRKYGIADGQNRKARVISVVNHKGGVGKTTTTINLGTALALEGYKVLVVDMDSQGNLSQSLGILEPEAQLYEALDKEVKPLPIVTIQENLDLVPSNLELAKFERELTITPSGPLFFRSALAPVLSNYDYVLIDCPPALNVFTHSALIASSSALVVLEPEMSAVRGINNLFELITEIRRFFNEGLELEGILLTRVDRRLVVHKEMISSVRNQLGRYTIFKTEIRLNAALKESQVAQQDIFRYNSSSTGAQDYKALAIEILAGSQN